MTESSGHAPVWLARPRRLSLAWLVVLTAGCGTSPRSAGPPEARPIARPQVPSARGPTTPLLALVGGTVVGVGPAALTIAGSKIEAVGEPLEGAERVDVSGRFLAPAFVDAHVHLSYLPAADALLSRGVAAVVDLAAPLDALSLDVQPLTLLGSGPMLTAPRGYPLTSWGRDGYGLEVATPEAASNAVDQLFEAGALLIKTPITSEPTLDDATLAALVERAHERGLKVAAHALGAREARRAADAGIDLLAHTPTEALDAETLDAFGSRAVISTLAAFGGGEATLANLRALREHGATVLYGTDFGNTRDPGIQAAELALLEQAGLDGAAILEAGTRAPARYFGLSGLGELTPGKRAAILVLAADPLKDPSTLAAPLAVYIDGQARP